MSAEAGRDISMNISGVTRLDAASFSGTSSPLQSRYWACLKGRHGWSPFYFSYIHVHTAERQEIMVLVRTFPFGQKLAYVPFAPAGSTTEEIKELSQALLPLLPKGIFVMRYDVPWGSRLESDRKIARLHFCRQSVQPVSTVRVDLSHGMEAVRNGFRQRCRRQLRKAGEHGIVIRHWDGKGKSLSQWYAMYLETARRDGFTPRALSYIKDVLDMGEAETGDEEKAFLSLAYDAKGIMVGGIIVLLGKQEAVYLYGASYRDTSAPGASYLLQADAMGIACRAGCSIYDFYGISATHDGQGHLGRLDLFKTSFGGSIEDRSPSLDYCHGRLRHWVYTHMENIRYSLRRDSV